MRQQAMYVPLEFKANFMTYATSKAISASVVSGLHSFLTICMDIEHPINP